MDLVVAYQNELLAGIAICVVIFIYIIIKRKSSTQISNKEQEALLADVTHTTENLEETHMKEPKKGTQEAEDVSLSLLDGKEEGNFGVIEEQKAQTPHQKEKRTIVKRDVPPHAKITKDNFKEFSGLRILLAEDNIINQKVILGLLAESNIEIVVANDGVEALEILEKDQNFTIILMDAHMPRIDGFEATRKIRVNPDYNHIVVIALSGDTAADDIRKMSEAGMSEHLEKPLKMDALYDMFYAYSSNDNQQNSYNEFDVNEGLEIAGNDITFYNEILHEFIKSYESSHEKVEEFLKHNNTSAADKYLLDIIGVSANIGANKLTKTATELKNSLNNNNDNQNSRLLFKLKEDLKNLIQDIRNYLQYKISIK